MPDKDDAPMSERDSEGVDNAGQTALVKARGRRSRIPLCLTEADA